MLPVTSIKKGTVATAFCSLAVRLTNPVSEIADFVLVNCKTMFIFQIYCFVVSYLLPIG